MDCMIVATQYTCTHIGHSCANELCAMYIQDITYTTDTN